MEAFSWAFHKYIMHGPLWFVHKTHHLPHKGAFELNDFFSLVFGLIAIALIIAGLHYGNGLSLGMGTGITLYGVVYFVLHDVAIHNRIKATRLSKSEFFRRIRMAHKIHHKHLGAKPSRSFGLLFVRESIFEGGKNS